MDVTREIIGRIEQVEQTTSQMADILEHLASGTNEIEFSAAEVSALWNQYMGDSLSVCVYTHFLQTAEKEEVRSILETALQLSQTHLEQITRFFKQAGFQLPLGFQESDVHSHAPRLFSDHFMVFYSEIMTTHGLTAYSLALTTCEDERLRNYFFDCSVQAKRLLDQIIAYEQSNNLYSTPSSIASPAKVEFVQKKGLLSGLIGKPEPLNATEIGNLFFNTKKNALNKALFHAFGQVAGHEDVREYMLDGVQRAGKDIDSFVAILEEEQLTTPRMWESDVTESTVSPFSDKLMMYHMAFLTSTALTFYATGLASSMRPDVIMNYNHIFENIHTGYRKIYMIMTKHNWMEKQPGASDRSSLTQ
ncbi:hypothetical protein PAESOLCIP111_04125 [Paenibacillus solanacearum]|uniref:DUF3231 family protein n=1 Tax=Paenibacillus solanacearum TaxID=2048548 RepID=A0A916K3T2_9BACL|nr:DUF3231 family protein [Paenibacillus solanacearum]CAG7640337.1 hypothetical protein PAESOLCIP111_04125 [Paenibacillus solanacearum]